MAEMEKEGRPPENKRSRKPAHPVKREINEEMKSFAENTMNELLGWYGYDKVELRDSDNLDIGEMPQHISILRDNVLPKNPALAENSEGSPDQANGSHSLPTSRNGVAEPSTSNPSTTEHGSMPIIVPMIPPPLIKPSADEDASSVQIMCAWCQKVGVKRYSLNMGSELKSFCSEKCFAACRRAYFKRNKARDDDGIGGKLPQHCFTQDPTRLVFKTNSDVLVCDWCKHIRHTKEYLDFGAGERRLQFCSAKCLNQYKMDIFYKETQAALPGALCNPGHGAGSEGTLDCSGGVQLLTPESWGTTLTDLRRKAPSPGRPSSSSGLPPSTSSANSPLDTAAVCSPSPSSLAKIPTPKPHDSPALPHPPISALRQPVGVPSGSPPMVMTSRGPMPLPLFMEHQMMQQIRPPFLRPSSHPAGPNSPMSNPLIPGIGPPPPPRTLGLASSPMHRPMVSPHMHPSSNPNPGMIPPYPGIPMPGLPPFPPMNMMPNGTIPLPPMMNFGMPTLAPLVPPPTLLVPYPVIVPLPVPIPIPIPIPFNPKSSRDQPESSSSIHSTPEPSGSPASQPHSPGYYGGNRREQKIEAASSLSPPSLMTSRTAFVDLTVKSENNYKNICPPSEPGLTDGVIDLTVGQRSRPPQTIQRKLPGVRIKIEVESESRSPPAAGIESEEKGKCDGEAGVLCSQVLLSTTDLEEETHLNTAKSSATPFCNNSSSAIAVHLANQVNPSTPPLPSTVQTEPPPIRQPLTSPLASCNVIVNGAGWHTMPNTPFESFPDQSEDGIKSEGETKELPPNGDLEHDALKENTCSVTKWERGTKETEVGDAAEEKPDPDSNLEEGEHAYTFPLLSTGGCVVIQPVPKPASDKTAILSCSISAPLSTAGSPEPPHKRRCLRIRNQNK
ncbi:sine oculis-binding protein homolog A isoform X2 [Gouania willdenowi]|uniref:sine oculis-binding protein homolog A isoform X2 n=1 Tax=Gouania willdenowi TaxID=441366 RepID=UPI0010548A92|nr:sine oculis-binding protein homolog isoform X2 [Gouania willdenowi]